MAEIVPTLWAIRAGRDDEAHDLFLKCNWIALDRSVTGDLRELLLDITTYMNRLREFPRYADLPDQSLREKASQLIRFLVEVKVGDHLLYSSKTDATLYFGRIVGEYVFIPSAPYGFAHRRPVEWITSSPRSNFSAQALRQADRPTSLYTIENDADEFRTLINNSAPSVRDYQVTNPVEWS